VPGAFISDRVFLFVIPAKAGIQSPSSEIRTKLVPSTACPELVPKVHSRIGRKIRDTRPKAGIVEVKEFYFIGQPLWASIMASIHGYPGWA